MYSSHDFPISQYRVAKTIPVELQHAMEIQVYQNVLNDTVVELTTYFAQGKQVKTDYSSNRNVIRSHKVPVNAWNWLKELIVTWCPTLNFGWLKPEYFWIETEVIVNETATYLNVYPVDAEQAKQNRLYQTVQMTPTEWLYSEPCTRVEYWEAEIDKYKSSDVARFMVG